MGSFFLNKGQVLIIPLEDSDEPLLAAENAFVEKKEDYWVVKNVQDGDKNDRFPHYLIKDGQRIDNYCQFCQYRLRSLHTGCHGCSFLTLPNKTFNPMNLTTLIDSLRANNYYQVDYVHFKNELALRKKNKVRQ